jgi:hypothetical protein
MSKLLISQIMVASPYGIELLLDVATSLLYNILCYSFPLPVANHIVFMVD